MGNINTKIRDFQIKPFATLTPVNAVEEMNKL